VKLRGIAEGEEKKAEKKIISIIKRRECSTENGIKLADDFPPFKELVIGQTSGYERKGTSKKPRKRRTRGKGRKKFAEKVRLFHRAQ